MLYLDVNVAAAGVKAVTKINLKKINKLKISVSCSKILEDNNLIIFSRNMHKIEK